MATRKERLKILNGPGKFDLSCAVFSGTNPPVIFSFEGLKQKGVAIISGVNFSSSDHSRYFPRLTGKIRIGMGDDGCDFEGDYNISSRKGEIEVTFED